MASIITATTTSGLTQSADNSGVLQLASGAGNLVTVPSVTGTAMVSGNMPAFSAYKNASQSISTSTTTKVTYETEYFDTNNCFASSTFTPTVAGYYQINITASVETTSADRYLQMFIYKNGSSAISCQPNYGSSVSGNGLGMSLCGMLYMNGTTDYIEIYARTNSTTTILNTGVDNTFSASLVRAA
jgi:hypothetical protein